MILGVIGDTFTPPLTAADLADVSGARTATLAEWERRMEAIRAEWHTHPQRLRTVRQSMEDRLLTGFRGLINELRQRALGIEQYVWRSRDDARVRDSHAEYDDRIFDWDTPPEGGHPGQAYNCRCHAEPFLPDEPDYVPDTGIAYTTARLGAEVEGIAEAGRDFGVGLLEAISELPGKVRTAARFAWLVAREAAGNLSEEQRAELAELRQSLEDRVEEIAAFWRDSPEIAAAFLDYVVAVRARPDLADAAYRAGLATRAQVEAAHRERAYLETLILLNVAPGIMAARLLRRSRHRGKSDGRDDLADALLAEAARARRHPADVDWDAIDNPGIAWSGPIRSQGEPWEDLLEASGDYGRRSPSNFPTFDFFDPVSRVATSAKTLDTQAPTYRDRPSRIFARLRNYVDRIERFEEGRSGDFRIRPGQIEARRLELAVPFGTTPEQAIQIQRAIDYASEWGIEVNVRFVQ
ncbi:phage minor head protein [Jhaorihella thermophila]